MVQHGSTIGKNGEFWFSPPRVTLQEASLEGDIQRLVVDLCGIVGRAMMVTTAAVPRVGLPKGCPAPDLLPATQRGRSS